MTLGQLKELMKYENLVNMDARTVISCLPLHLADAEVTKQYFRNMPLYRSMLIGDKVNHVAEIYNYINNCRMFDDQEASLIPLENLKEWEWQNGEFVNKIGYHFKVIFCDIEIEGREVKRWTQPLFEATGIATFGLLCTEVDGIMKFVVRSKSEIGNFDGPELLPLIQREADEEPSGVIEEFFMKQYLSKNGIVHDIILSEEGGRFYHEQNQNIILNIPKECLPELPEGYFLVDYRTLSELVQVNNVLNIQLRNLLSLLEV
jgi:oxidase EvaA